MISFLLMRLPLSPEMSDRKTKYFATDIADKTVKATTGQHGY